MLEREIKENLEKADSLQVEKWKNKIANILAQALIYQNEDVQDKYIPLYKLISEKAWKVL